MSETESQFDDSEMNDEDCTSGGDFILAVNGPREIRDKLTGFETNDDTTSGDNFLAAVNDTREVRDRLTGFVEGVDKNS